MPKPKVRKQENPPAKEPQAQESGSITFSTRFTKEQRDRIVEAAEVRGWTPSNLMRVATLEKSAHILNTSKQTRFDFKGVVARVAKQLTDADAWGIAPDGGRCDLDDLGVPDYTVEKLTPTEIQVFKQACRLGGAEFLYQILEACESFTAPGRKDLPEPIDPA